MCADGYVPGVFGWCGKEGGGGCNIFGCNCGGGCRTVRDHPDFEE